MINRCFTVLAMTLLATIALTGIGFAETVFTYTSTPDNTSMSMPADQGWTQVATDTAAWGATYDSGYNNTVYPAPRYVADDNVPTGKRGYIYQELTAQQEADALSNGWVLTMRARMYQGWNAGFSTNGPEHELGFGVKTSGGDAIVGQKLQRQTSPTTVYATFVALFGSDEEDNITRVETPRLGQADALSPTYMDYVLSYDPATQATSLTVSDARTAVDKTHTITNNLAPSAGLWDGVGSEDANMLPAAIYVGYADSAVTGGHAYVDYLTFEINEVPEPSTLAMLTSVLICIAGFLRKQR